MRNTDPTTLNLKHWADWASALEIFEATRYERNASTSAAERAERRDQQAAVFLPVFHELATMYGETASCALTRETTDPEQKSQWAIRMHDTCTILVSVLHDGLSMGLLQPFVTSLIERTSPMGTLDVNDVWKNLPLHEVADEVLQATLKTTQYYRLDHDVLTTLDWLVNAPSTALFWQGWERAATTNRNMVSFASSHDRLADRLADLLVLGSRNLGITPTVKTVFERIGRIKGWDMTQWEYAGYQAASTLKRSFVSFRSPDQDLLYEVAPSSFWKGLGGEVQFKSKIGRWITERGFDRAKLDPHGPEARARVLTAWLNLDRLEIKAVEAALPGATAEHLPTLIEVPTGNLPSGITLAPVREALLAPHGRWALAAFRKVGAPVDKTSGGRRGDLEFQGAFHKWQVDNPKATAKVVFSLHAQLEAKALSQVAQDLAVPETPLQEKRTSTVRRRL